MEAITLQEALAWVISGGGAGVIAWFLMDKIEFLKTLGPDYKRYASLALTALLAVAGWLASIGMAYVVPPETWRGWVESVFSVIAVALLVSQGVHGAINLRKRRLANS